MTEIGGENPSGGDGSRQPGANELELARIEGRHVSEIAKRLAG